VTPRRIAILVHPTRDVRQALAGVREWAAERGVELVELGAADDTPEVSLGGARMIVAVGGDGTVLAALRAAAPESLPVLGVACGSLGALTTVAAPELNDALDRFEAGEWTPHRIPALVIEPDAGQGMRAINDLVVVRNGGGQVTTTVEIDGALYGRWAGDGAVAATQIGSSAYSMAAGGPLLMPAGDAWVITPLNPHGGYIPAAVVGARQRVRLVVEPGYAGARVEVDGRETDLPVGGFDLTMQEDFATLVRVGDHGGYLAGLRRRRILIDSARVLARDARAAASAAAPQAPAPGSDTRCPSD